MSVLVRVLATLPAFVAVAVLTASAVPPDGPKNEKSQKPTPPKGSAEEALAQVQVEKGLTVRVWAAEPLLANPVAFTFDEKGRAFIAETTRFGSGVPDTRGHMDWLDEDLACRTTADRLAMYARHNYKGYEKHDDQVRMVWDSTGGGAADKSSVFSSGYNRPQDGLAAGLLARKGQVYLADIPDLYVLKDTTGANRADAKTSLFTGFGPTVQFIGHDLHGLRMGPDGRLYFSVGDRGFNVTTKEGKQLLYPNTGAVLRCDPDGANLEVVHYGLRNPQELAFDDHGNLFTFDNNSDSGDRARWVYVVEGGDSGWRGGYQYGTSFHSPGTPQGNRGPWNSEKIWHMPSKDGEPPAYVVPPLLHFGNGPAGLTHYPGVGLNEKYKDHFFACDFTSNAGNSVIWSVAVKPKGAGFEVVKPEPFVRGMVPTDCEFGPDGAFYWSDWVGGWNPPGKGRIFKLTDPEAMKNPAVAGAEKLIAQGFDGKTPGELAKLLGHPHQQVRLEAQYALAALGAARPGISAATAAVVEVVTTSPNRLARIHALWAADMIRRKNSAVAFGFGDIVRDKDPEVRAQFAKVLGGWGPNTRWLVDLLADADPRVRFHAALSYGSALAHHPPAGRYLPLFNLLKRNADADPYLRHAAVVALARLSPRPAELFDALAGEKEKFDTPAVRLGVLLALRRHRSDRCAEYLADADPRLATEAARAIHDERIDGAMARLAATAGMPGQPDAVSFRALSANFKLGTADAAARVARFAARQSEPDHARVFALQLLGDWTSPPRRDHITGLTHDLPKRDAALAAAALKPVVAAVFAGADKVRTEAAAVSAKLGIKEVGPLLVALVRDESVPASARADGLFALAAVKDKELAAAASFAAASREPKLRAAALVVRVKADPAAVVKELPSLLKDAKASLAEKQAAFAVLGGMGESEAADTILAEWLVAAKAGDVPASLVLDVTEAAEARTKAPKLRLFAPLGKQLEAWRGSKDLAADNLSAWAESLAGGDAEKGRNVFLNGSAVYCQRCHKLDGQGGEVGPPLNGIAAQEGKDRRYLLESIVLPSAKIAKGYETAVLTLADGRTVSGVVKEDTKTQIKLVTAENKDLIVPAEEIESRRTGPSAMPDDLHKKMTRRELRDLVEFLAGLTDAAAKGGR